MNTLDLLNIGSNKLKNRNIISHKLDSEILLSKVLSKSREFILTNIDKKINSQKVDEFNKLIEKRTSHEPIAYILKEKEFWSRKFFVDKGSLIPRPETELMVEKISKIYKNRAINILDIGTGSGCILISLITELKNSRGIGVDISRDAIRIAKKNVKIHKLKNKIKLVNSSFSKMINKKFDLIVSNPPYIKKGEIKNLQLDIKSFEPKIALDGGNDGLDVITKVIYKSKEILKNNGMLALEIGNEQFKQVSKILIRKNFRIDSIIKDYKNNVRCILSKLN